MLYGYARVSTVEQETALQLDALRAANVDRIFEEKLSAVRRRPRLEALLYCLRKGDVVLVYKVDRLARSLSDLLRIIERIERAGASFRSLTEPIETGTPIGRLLIHQLGAFSEFERAVIRERCDAGMRAAMERGIRWGRPRRLDWHEVRQMAANGMNPCEIARVVGAHHTGIRYILNSPREG